MVRRGDLQWRGPLRCLPLCRHLRKREVPLAPVMVVIPSDQLGELELREDLFDDLCIEPINPDELSARLTHLFWRTGRGLRPDLLEHGPWCSTSRPTRPRWPARSST